MIASTAILILHIRIAYCGPVECCRTTFKRYESIMTLSTVLVWSAFGPMLLLVF